MMKPKVATLRPPRPGPHDPRQDAEWALQLALYEASIHPRMTKPFKLESFPTKIFVKEIPHSPGALAELKALFAGGEVAEIDFQLLSEDGVPGEWYGTTTVTFKKPADRDASFSALARFVRVYIGPLRDWVARKDIKKMQAEIMVHFSRFGRVRSSRIIRPSGVPGRAMPFALLDCHPSAAHSLLTRKETICTMATHRSGFKVSLADEKTPQRRCVVPLSTGACLATLG